MIDEWFEGRLANGSPFLELYGWNVSPEHSTHNSRFSLSPSSFSPSPEQGWCPGMLATIAMKFCSLKCCGLFVAHPGKCRLGDMPKCPPERRLGIVPKTIPTFVLDATLLRRVSFVNAMDALCHWAPGPAGTVCSLYMFDMFGRLNLGYGLSVEEPSLRKTLTDGQCQAFFSHATGSWVLPCRGCLPNPNSGKLHFQIVEVVTVLARRSSGLWWRLKNSCWSLIF